MYGSGTGLSHPSSVLTPDQVLYSTSLSLLSHVQVSAYMEVCGVPSIAAPWPGEQPSVRLSPSRVFYALTSYSFSPLKHSIWYGVQAWIGGECMKVMLRAMWPSVNDIRTSFVLRFAVSLYGVSIEIFLKITESGSSEPPPRIIWN